MQNKLIKQFIMMWLLAGCATLSFADTGIDWYAAGKKPPTFYAGPTLQYTNIYVRKFKYQGLSPRLTVGYGGMTNNVLYLAAEIFGTAVTASLKNHPAPAGSLRTSYSYGASLLPGYLLDDVWMLYARLGYITSRFVNVSKTKAGY